MTTSSVFATISQESANVNVGLTTEIKSIQPGRSFSVGLFFKLEKGWHTYWLNPGDSGLPVAISWKLPPGFIHGDIQWPYPSLLGTDSVANFGYEEEVLLITDIRASPDANIGETIKIEAEVEWLVCKEECLPGHAVLSVNLPVDAKEPAFDPVWKAKFTDTRKKLPVLSQDWPVHAAIEKDHLFLQVRHAPWFKDDMLEIYFFPEQAELFDHSEPQIVKNNDNGYTIQVKLSKLAQKFPSKLEGVLVSDQSWSRVSENKALRVVVPLAHQNHEKKTQKEVTR
ncbi:MAG: protein-disulfide reductase DsbD family protein [Candidatus Aminicenantes bacterium]